MWKSACWGARKIPGMPSWRPAQGNEGGDTSQDPVFHARVILADPRGDATRDTILWYRGQDARTSTGAENRAAVVALHDVMGDRR